MLSSHVVTRMAFLLLSLAAAVDGWAQFEIEYETQLLARRFECDGMKYCYWNYYWVTVEGCADHMAQVVTFVDTVRFRGQDFVVAETGPGVCKDMRRLERVVLNHLGTALLVDAFTGCPRLRVLEIPVSRPPKIGEHFFYGGAPDEVFENYHFLTVAVVVPPGSEDTYRHDSKWGRFHTIISHTPAPGDYDLTAIHAEIVRLQAECDSLSRREAELLQRINALSTSTQSSDE